LTPHFQKQSHAGGWTAGVAAAGEEAPGKEEAPVAGQARRWGQSVRKEAAKSKN
jgi:uncharacterized membrane protein YgcG